MILNGYRNYLSENVVTTLPLDQLNVAWLEASLFIQAAIHGWRFLLLGVCLSQDVMIQFPKAS